MITASISSDAALAALVDVEVYAADGTKLFQRWFDDQTLRAREGASYTVSWQVPHLTSPETYHVRIGVFQPRWVSLYHWNSAAAQITVPAGMRGASSPAPTPQERFFATLPPGAALPSGEECAARVRRAAWEPRLENWPANHHVVPPTKVSISGASTAGNAALAPRIDGNFVGTTDEIIQWGACKWGLDENIVRAVAVKESRWWQNAVGDFNGREHESHGLLQVRIPYHSSAFPAAQESTAFNVDYALAWRRSCFEGHFTEWLQADATGDEWGCVALWASGRWNDASGRAYADEVRSNYAHRTWLEPGF